MIWASLAIEREPPSWGDFPNQLVVWARDVGLIATIALVIYSISFLLEKRPSRGQKRTWTFWLVLLATCATFLCYGLFFVLLQQQGLIPEELVSEETGKTYKVFTTSKEQNLSLAVGGFCALFAVILPMLVAVAGRLAWRRIWAIARLSIKESIRNRTVWVFGLMGLVFLFYGFFVSYRPEDQIRNYVTVIFTPMTILFLVTAALLGSFSIPVDVVKQTIHTIVTKPVERYEIVLGRFIGHGALLTMTLAVLTVLSLGYVIRGVNPVAAKESGKARVPVYGDRLTFYGTGDETKGENVGREWTYRSYVRGRLPGESIDKRQYAIWWFEDVPEYVAARETPAVFEYTFDIFRTTRGKEDQPIQCDIIFADGRYNVDDLQQLKAKFNSEYEKLQEKITSSNTKDVSAAIAAARLELIAKHGYLEQTVPVIDYHTGLLKVPSTLLRALKDRRKEAGEADPPAPLMKVFVAVNERDVHSRQQLIGVARRDFYLLAAEYPFWQNFIKGMFGLWCNTMLILGIAVGCSTYFSGIISLLVTVFFLIAGALVEFIRSLALGTAAGGGPTEAAIRMALRKPPSAPLEPTSAAAQVGSAIDAGYRIYLNFVLKFIPDIHRYDLTEYIKEGFNIPVVNVLLLDNFMPMMAYLIPWGVLAYYLMNSREIANPR